MEFGILMLPIDRLQVNLHCAFYRQNVNILLIAPLICTEIIDFLTIQWYNIYVSYNGVEEGDCCQVLHKNFCKNFLCGY